MACQTIASGTGFGNLCLSWVQTRAGLPHVGATALDAWSIYSGRGATTGSPVSGDLVFFGGAPINGGAGHVGIVNGDGSFTSVLSDGNEYSCDISTFAAQNAPVLGYISTTALGGSGGGLSLPGISLPGGNTLLVGAALVIAAVLFWDYA